MSRAGQTGYREPIPRLARLDAVRVAFLLVAGFWAHPDAALAGAPTCTISMTTAAFGNLNVLPGTAVDTTATITVTCSGGGGNGQRLCISIGAGSAGDATSRQLTGPAGATLRYDLYSDSARTARWGSWQTGYGGGAGIQIDVPQSTTNTLTVYGRVLASQQTAATGSYSSTFTANPYMQYDDKASTACPIGARNASASTSASATVTSSCSVSTTALNFGSTGTLGTAVNGTSTVTATCTSAAPYNIGLNVGGGTGATVASRKMTSGANTITYSLYKDSARSTVWGNTVGTDTLAGTGSGTSQGYTVYGRVPSQTTPAPGTYSDSIVATVTY